jgi:Protein of unknown function VcgC/VcgE (DUF2780)
MSSVIGKDTPSNHQLLRPVTNHTIRGGFDMSDIVNQLASQTGISTELIQKGLGAFFTFLKKELGEETYTEVEASVPDAANAVKTFETAPEASQGSASLLGMVADLAGKFLGGKSGAGAELMASFSKLGFKPEQIESFLPKVLELIKAHLSPELVQKIMASLPALAAILGAGAKKEA